MPRLAFPVWQSPRFWRFCSWVAATFTVFIFILWIASARYQFSWRGLLAVSVRYGQVVIFKGTSSNAEFGGVSKLSPNMNWWFHWTTIPLGTYLIVPIWFAAIVSVCGAAQVCRHTRVVIQRSVLRCSNCGYSRANLGASEPCPECGLSPELRWREFPRLRAIARKRTRVQQAIALGVSLFFGAEIAIWQMTDWYAAGWFGEIKFVMIAGGSVVFGEIAEKPLANVGLFVRAINAPYVSWYVAPGNPLVYSFSMIPLLLVSVAMVALVWRWAFRAARKAVIGLCPECGGDRTGAAASSPCPTCPKVRGI